MVNRWVTLTSNLGLETASGASYAFGVYSDQLKNITGFSQDEIQTVASTGNIGLYFALIAGIVFDNVGPVTTLTIGIVLSTAGYLAMWSGAKGYIPGDGQSLCDSRVPVCVSPLPIHSGCNVRVRLCVE
eukprot:m.137238 g.137238  ORF g.137238 m.137238 type:complete len:129 (-) comp13969_c1_seq7:2732-3118(-)